MILAGLALLIVLVLIAVVVIVFVQRRGTTSSGAQAGVVQGYLTAIAAGDSQRALGYLAERPGNTELLTDHVLAASKKIASMTGISVSQPEQGSNSVQAWYKIGDQRYQQQFDLRPSGNGYRLSNATATADLSGLPKGLTYQLDGTAVNRGTVTLFPGSYQLTSDIPLIDLGRQSRFVAQPQDRLTVAVTPSLTSAGSASVRTAIDTAIKGCLKVNTLKAGCGLSLTGNGQGSSKIKDGTVKRSLSTEAAQQLGRLELIMDAADPTLIRTTGISGNIRTVATCESTKTGKKSGKTRQLTKECTLRGAGTSLSSPQVRLAGSKLTVEWY